jgi:hypothetical protein
VKPAFFEYRRCVPTTGPPNTAPWNAYRVTWRSRSYVSAELSPYTYHQVEHWYPHPLNKDWLNMCICSAVSCCMLAVSEVCLHITPLLLRCLHVENLPAFMFCTYSPQWMGVLYCGANGINALFYGILHQTFSRFVMADKVVTLMVMICNYFILFWVTFVNQEWTCTVKGIYGWW